MIIILNAQRIPSGPASTSPKDYLGRIRGLKGSGGQMMDFFIGCKTLCNAQGHFPEVARESKFCVDDVVVLL